MEAFDDDIGKHDEGITWPGRCGVFVACFLARRVSGIFFAPGCRNFFKKRKMMICG